MVLPEICCEVLGSGNHSMYPPVAMVKVIVTHIATVTKLGVFLAR